VKVVRLPGLVLVGAVRGPVSEVDPLLAELERADPSKVVMQVSPEELRGLQEHFTAPLAEPLSLLLDYEIALAESLSAFGEVRLPSPAYVMAMRWAKERGRELIALDPDEDEYTNLFLKHMGYLSLVRRARAERALKKSPPDAPDAEELVCMWNNRIHADRRSRNFLEERRRLAAEKLREICEEEKGRKPVVAVVDFEHWSAISSALSEPQGQKKE
jgi:hypothetical protein